MGKIFLSFRGLLFVIMEIIMDYILPFIRLAKDFQNLANLAVHRVYMNISQIAKHHLKANIKKNNENKLVFFLILLYN